MKVIQNFSSRKHIKDFPIIDTLIWYVGLLKLKLFGYTTKLYCEKKDFEFLKHWGLLDLYDEIDDTFLSTDFLVKNDTFINGTNFWSKRKIECIKHEFEVSKESFVYMDTDIILNDPLEIGDVDLFAWSNENNGEVYIDWEHLSTSEDYIMPRYIYENREAYNCGILYFKDQWKFMQYRTEYLNYVINNPCILYGVDCSELVVRNVWACNAEQRILRAVAKHNNWKVGVIEGKNNYPYIGIDDKGAHYYCYRGCWRLLDKEKPFTDEQKRFWKEQLNFQVSLWLSILKVADKNALNRFLKVNWINDFYNNGIEISEYK